MNIHKRLILVSFLLIVAGMAIVAPVIVFRLQQRQAFEAASAVKTPVPATAKTVVAKPGIIKGAPRHIAVPSLGIDVDVLDGAYNTRTGEWTLSEETAFYGTPTELINSDSGNTLVYGHNSDKIFGKLLQITSGAEVIVTTDNGYKFTYIYQTTEAVEPTDVHALEYSGTPRLTLQTCSGVWNQTRQMFYFGLKSYDKI
jgi:LPXTG-site transpeptidase (sortase) family protein